MENMINPEIQKTLEWFLSFLTHDEWIARKDSIENKIEKKLKLSHTNSSQISLSNNYLSLLFQEKGDDTIGWYLYLAEVELNNIVKSEPHQRSQVLPIFEKLGENFGLLKQIGGIEEKVKKLLSPKSDPNAILFEILVALLWKKNGYDNVMFIPETSSTKQPDIKAISKNNEEYYIECKRLTTVSDYSKKECNKWDIMWKCLEKYLTDHKLPLVFEITFHVELNTLEDDFVIKQLKDTIPLLIHSYKFQIIKRNETWEVKYKSVDFHKIEKHLEDYQVKSPSTQLGELIGGRYDPKYEFSYVYEPDYHVRHGEGIGNNFFVNKIRFACGVYWYCDAQRAIEKKARGILDHLSKAVEQLPENSKSMVHFGIEAINGPFVETLRQDRIFDALKGFNTNGKDLSWVFCHFFSSYSPPDQGWVMDEKVFYYQLNPQAELPLSEEKLQVMLVKDHIQTGRPIGEY